MNQPGVTIIIPCFNCTKTLAAAFESCFTQGIEGPFEIVMVDDASTDGTKPLMEQLASKHPNVKLGFHEKNLSLIHI